MSDTHSFGPLEPHRHVWELAPHIRHKNLWKWEGIKVREIAMRTWRSLVADRVFGHAAELGFYFLFALFPTLFSASSLLGLAARSADLIYIRLLDYLSLVIPTSALGTVLATFNETTAASTSGKLTFGLVAAIWSASVGISATQDTLNAVYRINESRSYIRARLYAIGLTILLTAIVSVGLGCMFVGDFTATFLYHYLAPGNGALAALAAGVARIVCWIMATALLSLAFAVVYYWAPDFKVRHWHWFSPGTVVGIFGWLIASLGFRIYLHFFNTYSVTYGSLGAVIILLMWFYITGLMLLTGAEINCAIESAAAELHRQGQIRRQQHG